ncbi:uncharacterized protein HaLaN_19614 [Haematococcus lacustris]|uniref:Uncharacterized protein n=1 Tax=Haematococcus lacustris TaxID=44745 RepID=A0A699ZR80_HAELA|nr:uncharacterized protein HaLaN_19614 [Haematococcus lacustris]
MALVAFVQGRARRGKLLSFKATYGRQFSSNGQGGALEAALDIYEWLVAGREVAEPIAADISTYNALIKACHQAGLLEKALEIASWVMSSGVQFDGTTYDELIATLEIAQLWDVKAAKGISSGSFLASKVERKDHCFVAPGLAPGAGQLTRLEAGRNPVATVRSGMEYTLFPDQLRPAPFDGLRFMYLDHLEDLQEEAALAALKLRTSSWAASTLMRGGRGQTGKHTPPACTSAPEAAAGSGIFTNSCGAAAKRPALAPHLPRILAPFTPVALSRAPSFKGLSLENVHAAKHRQLEGSSLCGNDREHRASLGMSRASLQLLSKASGGLESLPSLTQRPVPPIALGAASPQ